MCTQSLRETVASWGIIFCWDFHLSFAHLLTYQNPKRKVRWFFTLFHENPGSGLIAKAVADGVLWAAIPLEGKPRRLFLKQYLHSRLPFLLSVFLKVENRTSKKNLHSYIYCSIIDDSQAMETTKVSINR